MPGRACRTNAILGRSSGHGPGVHARQFMSRSSERNDSTAWGNLAGSGVKPLPAIAAGHAGGRGQSERPIWVPTHRFGVPPTPRHGAVRSLSSLLRLPHVLDFVIAWTPPSCRHRMDSALLSSPGLHPPNSSPSSCRQSRLVLRTDASCMKPHKARDDTPAVREISHHRASPPPQTYWWRVRAIVQGTERP